MDERQITDLKMESVRHVQSYTDDVRHREALGRTTSKENVLILGSDEGHLVEGWPLHLRENNQVMSPFHIHSRKTRQKGREAGAT